MSELCVCDHSADEHEEHAALAPCTVAGCDCDGFERDLDDEPIEEPYG